MSDRAERTPTKAVHLIDRTTPEHRAKVKKELDEFLDMMNKKEDEDSLTPLGRETRAFGGSYKGSKCLKS